MKKLLAIILALLMLALPVVGLAEADFISEAVENGRRVESNTTFKLDYRTGEESVDQIIDDVLNALTIAVYRQEAGGQQSGLRVNMGGADILSFDAAVVDELLYLRTDLLGDDTVVIAQDDVQPVAEKVIRILADNGLIDEKEAESALAELGTALSGASNPMANVDFEAMMNAFDLTGLEQFAEEFAAKVEQGDVSGLPEGSDPAASAITMKLTAEDIVKVYDVLFEAMKGNKEYLAMLDTMIVSVDDVEMSAEDAVNTMQEQLKTLLPEAIDGEIPLTIYLNENEEIVAATLSFTMKAETSEGSAPETVNADFTYRRQTAEDQTNHSVVYAIAGESVQVTMTADIAVKDGAVNAVVAIAADDGVMTFTFAMNSQGGETEKQTDVVFTVAFVENGAEAFNLGLDVKSVAKKDGQDAEKTTDVALSLSGMKLVTMTTVSKTVDPEASIVTDGAIRLVELSQDDLQSWLFGQVNNLQLWAVKAIQSLPASVLMLLMGQ